MSNRIEADEAKAQSNRHRETTATAPVLDSTRQPRGRVRMRKEIRRLLVAIMVIVVFYGVLKLRRMQATYDAHCPPKSSK